VATAMLDVHRMIGNRRIQIGDAKRAPSSVFVSSYLKTEYPFPGRRFCRTLAQRRLNGGDGT